MICAISRFRIANGTEAVVAEAFAHRVGLVDAQPGFLGLEVFTDAADSAIFYLATRWTDEASFSAWHKSDAHRESHKAMPRGIKLDKAHTRLFLMNRLPSGARAGGIEPLVADAAPFMAEFLHDARAVLFIAARTDGTIEACNPAAAERIGAQGPGSTRLLWDALVEDDAKSIGERVASGERKPGERFLVRLRGDAQSLECRLDLRPGGFVLIGERIARSDEAVLEEMSRISSEVFELSRESERKGRALARALAEVETKNAALEEANLKITELSRTDPMTGLCNRRHFDAAAATEIDRAHRLGSPLCAAMVDLDHFKSVNDRYGHGVGDDVLIAAAGALKAHSRPYDIVARYGGEEFVLLLPGTSLEGGVECAGRLRAAIEAMTVANYPHRMTASLGVALLDAGEDADALVGRADAALYRAKENGRNRVEADRATARPRAGDNASIQDLTP
jgi:diguanylate cyclase (GGDEF)-like protein